MNIQEYIPIWKKMMGAYLRTRFTNDLHTVDKTDPLSIATNYMMKRRL